MIKVDLRQILIIVSLLILSVSNSVSQSVRSKCKPVDSSVGTMWGKQNIVLREYGIFKLIRGTVRDEERPLAGVLVELYDKPEGLLLPPMERERLKAKQKRIGACETGEDGQFSFANIPSGKYELRFSKADQWDSTSVYIVVDPKNKRGTRKKLIVRLHISQ